MIRDKMLNQLSDMADEELTFANATFSAFHSAHEGYAVLMEEVEEACEETKEMSYFLDTLKTDIRSNKLGFETVECMEEIAIHAAAEAIQVAAMCRKYRESLGAKE